MFVKEPFMGLVERQTASDFSLYTVFLLSVVWKKPQTACNNTVHETLGCDEKKKVFLFQFLVGDDLTLSRDIV